MSDIRELWDSVDVEEEPSSIRALWDSVEIEEEQPQSESSRLAQIARENPEDFKEAGWIETLRNIPLKTAAQVNSMVGSGINTVEDFLNTETQIGANMRERSSGIMEELQAYENLKDAPEKQFASDVGTGILTMAPMLALPGTALGVATGAGTMGLASGADKYSELREDGSSKGEAALGGLTMGAVETATELVPMGRFLKKIPGSKNIKDLAINVAKGGAENALQEMAAEASSQAINYYANGDVKGTLGDIGYSGLVGAGVGVGLGVGASQRERQEIISAEKLEADAEAEANARIAEGDFIQAKAEEDTKVEPVAAPKVELEKSEFPTMPKDLAPQAAILIANKDAEVQKEQKDIKVSQDINLSEAKAPSLAKALEVKPAPVNPKEQARIELPGAIVTYESQTITGKRIPGITISDKNGTEFAIESEDIGNKTLEVYNSSLPPNLRGKGLGFELYNRLITEAKKRGYENIVSDTSVSDSAAAIWEKLGAVKNKNNKKDTGLKENMIDGKGQTYTLDNAPLYTLSLRSKNLSIPKQLRIKAIAEQQVTEREQRKAAKTQKNIEKIVKNLSMYEGRKAPEDVKARTARAFEAVVNIEKRKDFKVDDALNGLAEAYKKEQEERLNFVKNGQQGRRAVFNVAAIQKAILDDSVARNKKLEETKLEREIRNASRRYQEVNKQLLEDVRGLKSLKEAAKSKKYFKDNELANKIKSLTADVKSGRSLSLALLKKSQGKPLTKYLESKLSNENLDVDPDNYTVGDVGNRQYDGIVFEVEEGNVAELGEALRYVPVSPKAKLLTSLTGKQSLNEREAWLLQDSGYEVGINFNTPFMKSFFGDTGRTPGEPDIRINALPERTSPISTGQSWDVEEEFLESLDYLNAPVMEMQEDGSITSQTFLDLLSRLNSEKGFFKPGETAAAFDYLSSKFLDFFASDPEGKRIKAKYQNKDVNSEKLLTSDAYYQGFVGNSQKGYNDLFLLTPALRVFRQKFSLMNGIAKRFPEFQAVLTAARWATVVLPSKNIHAAQEILNPFFKLKDPASKAKVNKELITSRLMTQKGFFAKEDPEYLKSKGFNDKEIEAFLAVREYMQGEALNQIKLGLLADPPNYLINQETGEPHNPEDLQKHYEKVDAFIEKMRAMKYVPFSRYGKFFVYSREANNGDGHFSFHDTREAQMEAIGKLKESGMRGDQIDEGTVKPPSSKAKLKGFDGMPLEFLAFLADTGDTEAAEILEQALPKMKSLPQNIVTGETGFFKSLMSAQLTPGFSTDLDRSIANYATKLSTWNARKVGKSMFRTAISGLEEGSYLREKAKETMEYITNGNDAAPTIRGLFAVWYLSRPLSAAVNLTQQLTFTLPMLSLHTNGSLTEASKTWLAAQKDAMAFLTVGQKGLSEKDPELFRYLSDLSSMGQLSDINTSEITQIGQGIKGTPKGFVQNVMKGAMAAFSGVEMMNRTHAATAYFKAVRKNNPSITPAEMIAGGMQFVLDTQGDGSRANKPEIFRGKGAMLGIFRSYTFLFYSTLKQQIGAKNFKVVAAMATIQMGLGGALAVPGVAIVLRILKMLGESPEEETRKFLAELSKEQGFEHDFYGDMFAHGFFGAIDSPLTMASSLNMGELLPEGNTTSSALDVITQGVLGVAASPFQNYDRSKKYLKDGYVSQAIEASAPALLKGLMRGVRSIKEDGLKDPKGDNFFLDSEGNPNITGMERAVLFVGGTPKRMSNEMNTRQYIFEATNEAKDKGKIEHRLYEAYRDTGSSKSPEFMELLEEAKENNWTINWNTFKSKFKSRDVRELEQAPKAIRGEIKKTRDLFDFPTKPRAK